MPHRADAARQHVRADDHRQWPRRQRRIRQWPQRHAGTNRNARRHLDARRLERHDRDHHNAAAADDRGAHCMIRVVIAEDQAMVLGALAALLEIEGDIQVVGRAQNGEEALAICQREKPDVLLTDVEMPRMTGLELATAVRKTTRVIILTTFARGGYLRRALEAGASGYLLKDSPAEQLANAGRRVAQGGRVVDPELAAEAWSEPDPLTDRERQGLRMGGGGGASAGIGATPNLSGGAGEGETSADIASTLNLSEGTVRNYLSEAINKLGAANRVEAARIAREKGWL